MTSVSQTNEVYEAVVIGVSSGGVHALNTVLPALPAEFQLPVMVVQHLSPKTASELPSSLDARCRINVKHVEDKERLEPGVVYIAPSDYHVLVEPDRSLALSVDEPVNCSRPAIDVLFESAADAFGSKLIGVILTGASSDGSLGLKCIKQSGGYALVEDPESAAAATMPRAALEATEVDRVAPIDEIAMALIRLAELRRPSRRDETTKYEKR